MAFRLRGQVHETSRLTPVGDGPYSKKILFQVNPRVVSSYNTRGENRDSPACGPDIFGHWLHTIEKFFIRGAVEWPKVRGAFTQFDNRNNALWQFEFEYPDGHYAPTTMDIGYIVIAVSVTTVDRRNRRNSSKAPRKSTFFVVLTTTQSTAPAIQIKKGWGSSMPRGIEDLLLVSFQGYILSENATDQLSGGLGADTLTDRFGPRLLFTPDDFRREGIYLDIGRGSEEAAFLDDDNLIRLPSSENLQDSVFIDEPQNERKRKLLLKKK